MNETLGRLHSGSRYLGRMPPSCLCTCWHSRTSAPLSELNGVQYVARWRHCKNLSTLAAVVTLAGQASSGELVLEHAKRPEAEPIRGKAALWSGHWLPLCRQKVFARASSRKPWPVRNTNIPGAEKDFIMQGRTA